MQGAVDFAQRIFRIAKSFAVVDFRQTPQPRNYFSRREQWRLLLLVISLGLVVLLMSMARDPRNWAWFFASDRGGKGPSSISASTGEAPEGGPIQQGPPKAGTSGTAVSPAPGKTGGEAAGGYFPGVNPTYFGAIRDDMVFRPQERDAWFNLFEVLRKADEASLRRASTGRVTFGQLLRQSEQDRGRLVTIGGTIRRTTLRQAPQNDDQVDQYYQTVFQPADNRSELMFVYCLYLPQGFPSGMNVSADVEVTGFYFKRWAYAAQDAVRSAPVLLARTVEWHRPTAGATKPLGDAASTLISIAAALCLSLLAVGYVYARTRRGPPREPAAPPQFDALRDVQPVSGPGPPWETTARPGPGA
jgi:hypothetical protein